MKELSIVSSSSGYNGGIEVWQFFQHKWTQGIRIILLYVLESRGSSPGRQGFKMGVAGDGDICGTIGGGIMEHKFVEMAKARMKEDGSNSGIFKQVHDKKALTNQSGMICSGEQTIFLYELREEDMDSVRALIQSLKIGRNGSFRISNNGINFSQEIPLQNFFYEKRENDFLLVEKSGYKNELHIVGGGHCSLALSKLMRGMDFYIYVYDTREGLNTMEQNIYAHQKIIPGSYSELASKLSGGKHVYIVIMTFGYRSDDEALRALINKEFRYIGMLGSKNKISKMFNEYRQENTGENTLEKIHSPVGIQIKSQTPEEIAISIAAEIILVKNKDQ